MSFIKYLKLKEVSEEDLEKIDLKRDLHFSNIFGSKLRIVVPLDQNSYLKDLIEKLEDLGYEVDYEDLINKKQAYKKIKTQQGEKLRPEKVGKILQANKQLELLDWWQKNGENLKNNKTGASIIISRSPIDVLRMSDHDGIESCHSPDGGFYQCAKQEARTGGAIAYVVKNSDLANVNLQDDEIFEDPDRNVDGIIPIERLRLRRLTNGNIDLLIPERKTYGIKNVGLLDAIKKWAKSSQSDLISKINTTDDFKSFKLKGGTYQDTHADELWSNLFNVSVSGKKRSQDEDEENKGEYGDVYERAAETLENHSGNWEYFSVSLDDDYEGGINYYGYGSFSIPKKLFTVKIGNYNDKNYQNIKRIVKDELGVDGLEDLEIAEYEDSYMFSFMFYDYDRHYDELTNFEGFLDYVDRTDNDFETNINKIKKELLEYGYIKDLSEKIEFKNFDIELDDEEFTIYTKEPEKIGFLKEYPMSKNNLRTWDVEKIKITGSQESFVALINNYRVLPFKVTRNNVDLFLKPNSTSGVYDNNNSVFGNTDSNRPENIKKITGWVYFNLNIHLDLDIYKNSEVVKRLKNLDNNWDFYLKKLGKLFDNIFRPHGPRKLSMAAAEQHLAFKNSQKQLAQKPVFKKPQKQLGLNFKEWLENLDYEKAFAQRDITQKTNVGELLGFPKKLNIIKQGSFATLYQHPRYKNKIIKITSHKSDVHNLIKAQNLNSINIPKVFNWDNKQKIKELPHLNSLAIIVEKINGPSMVYTTNDFYELTLGGRFNLSSDWILQGGNPKQKLIMEKYNKNNDQEHDKLFELFRTLYKLRKFYKIDLSDFEDNIIDSNDRYVLIDMGF